MKIIRTACLLIQCCLGPVAVLHGGTPVPTYGTYFGGTGDNVAVAVAVDSSGNVIVAGYTTSPTLPGTANAYQPTIATGFPGNQDVFIAKFSPSGALLWTTFLGGNSQDAPAALAVDLAGNIYVTGPTSSSNYPIQAVVSCAPVGGAFNFNSSAAFQQNCTMAAPGSNPSFSSFVSKLSSDGTKLIYSVGITGMRATALALNSQAEAYVGAFGPGVEDALFLFRLDMTGAKLVYGAFLGGGDLGFQASIAALAVDAQDNCYAVGSASINVPTTANALQRTNSNGNLTPDLGNGFILEVNPTGSQLVYGTWFGPQYFATAVTGITINSDGSLYFAGTSNATSFQATSGAYLSSPGGGFVAKLTPGAAALSAFSYLPFQSPPNCGTGPSSCGTVVLATNSQTQTAYVVFRANGAGGGMVELKLPTLGAAAPGPSYTLSPQTDFLSASVAVAAPSAVWIVGWCASCALGNLISANAFQSAPVSSGYTAVLLQLTDISPTISFLGSSATGSSPFVAGQLISIYGAQLGPTPGSSAQEGPGGVVTNSNGGTQVLFDGMAAPILYTGASQINTAIPCSVAGKASTQMVVQYLGSPSSPFTVPLSTAAPGIFTLNGTGSGEAVVLNQDYSLNGPANPAARGSAISFYATGIGPTSPCVDGQTYQSNFPQATLPVIAGVGNLGAQVLYAGQAPYFMTGVDQINIVIPSGSPTGSVPLSLLVNGVFSPPSVTIAVK